MLTNDLLNGIADRRLRDAVYPSILICNNLPTNAGALVETRPHTRTTPYFGRQAAANTSPVLVNPQESGNADQ